MWHRRGETAITLFQVEGPGVGGVCGVGDSWLAEVVTCCSCDCCYYCCFVRCCCYYCLCCFYLSCLNCYCGCVWSYSDSHRLRVQQRRIGTESKGAEKKGYQEQDGCCRSGGDSYLSGDFGSGSCLRLVGLNSFVNAR